MTVEAWQYALQGVEHIISMISTGQKPPSLTDILISGATAFAIAAAIVVLHVVYDACFNGDKSTAEEIDENEKEPRTPHHSQ